MSLDIWDAGGADGKLYISGEMGRIPSGAYRGDLSIREVYMDDPICEIGSYAFYGCKNLRKVILPDYLYKIGEGAFELCENLQEVWMGEYVNVIGNYAFCQCKKLKEIKLPYKLYVLGERAFSCCGLREVDILSNVFSVGKACFFNNPELQRVSVHDRLTGIGGGAFCGCSAQMNLELPPENHWLSYLDGYVLGENGQKLISCTAHRDTVTIPAGVVEIAEEAAMWIYMTHVNLPAGLRSIGTRAFSLNPYLQEITLPEGLQSIDAEAFWLTGITELVVPASVERIGKGILSGCNVRHLTILGSGAEIEPVCSPDNLLPDARLTADALEIEDYPQPFTAVHGLRSAAARYLAGETVPETAMERFRTYLAEHYRQHWDEPNIFALALALEVLPEESMKEAVQKATELNNAAVTAALLQYQHERFPQAGIGDVLVAEERVIEHGL